MDTQARNDFSCAINCFFSGLITYAITHYHGILASTLGFILTHDLHTGHYLAHLLAGNVSMAFSPCMFYITIDYNYRKTGSVGNHRINAPQLLFLWLRVCLV
jgi:hypothetical protein